MVDVCAVRDVRVSMPTSPGFLRALKLAVALRLPVRLLPAQPAPEMCAELTEAVTFYLRDPMVETPVEFFHSVLAFMCGRRYPVHFGRFLKKTRRYSCIKTRTAAPNYLAYLVLRRCRSLSDVCGDPFQTACRADTECTTCPLAADLPRIFQVAGSCL